MLVRTAIASGVIGCLLLIDLLFVGLLPENITKPLCFPVKLYIEISGVAHLGITQLLISFLLQWIFYSVVFILIIKFWCRFTHNKPLKRDS